LKFLLAVEVYWAAASWYVLLTLKLYTMKMVTIKKNSSLFNVVGVSFTKWAIEYEEPAGICR
jgi:hypothetical protein